MRIYHSITFLNIKLINAIAKYKPYNNESDFCIQRHDMLINADLIKKKIVKNIYELLQN